MTYSYILICTGHFDNIFFIKMSVWSGVKGVDAPPKQAIPYGTLRDRISDLVSYWGRGDRLLPIAK